MAELLRRGFDVYMTLVDDQGIDCIIRLDTGRYLDIQIKARSAAAEQWSTFAAMDFEARDNFFFIFYLEQNNTYWIIPSRDLESLCSTNVSGQNAGKRTLVLPKSDDGNKAESFKQYRGDNGFTLLTNYGAKPSIADWLYHFVHREQSSIEAFGTATSVADRHERS